MRLLSHLIIYVFIITYCIAKESLWGGISGKELNVDVLDESRVQNALAAGRLQDIVVNGENQNPCTNVLFVLGAIVEMPEMYTLCSLIPETFARLPSIQHMQSCLQGQYPAIVQGHRFKILDLLSFIVGYEASG